MEPIRRSPETDPSNPLLPAITAPSEVATEPTVSPADSRMLDPPAALPATAEIPVHPTESAGMSAGVAVVSLVASEGHIVAIDESTEAVAIPEPPVSDADTTPTTPPATASDAPHHDSKPDNPAPAKPLEHQQPGPVEQHTEPTTSTPPIDPPPPPEGLGSEAEEPDEGSRAYLAFKEAAKNPPPHVEDTNELAYAVASLRESASPNGSLATMFGGLSERPLDPKSDEDQVNVEGAVQAQLDSYATTLKTVIDIVDELEVATTAATRYSGQEVVATEDSGFVRLQAGQTMGSSRYYLRPGPNGVEVGTTDPMLAREPLLRHDTADATYFTSPDAKTQIEIKPVNEALVVFTEKEIIAPTPQDIQHLRLLGVYCSGHGRLLTQLGQRAGLSRDEIADSWTDRDMARYVTDQVQSWLTNHPVERRQVFDELTVSILEINRLIRSPELPDYNPGAMRIHSERMIRYFTALFKRNYPRR